jgi:hypothetical protein
MINRAPLLLTAAAWLPVLAFAAEKTPAERGRDALLTRSYLPPAWSRQTYDNVWKLWGVKERPAEYDKAFAERYGLHAAPYPNSGLPMGLREASGLLGKGIVNDCLNCHGGSILGKSIVGLPNSALDIQLLYEEMFQTEGLKKVIPFQFATVRGTTEAGAMAVYFLRMRDDELNLAAPKNWPLPLNLCEDPPAWWLLKKKKTMYHTGSTHAGSVRSIMQFTLTPFNSGGYVKQQEAHFRDIQAYIRGIEAPKYPFSIDQAKAEKGRALFAKHCASCHGTYHSPPSPLGRGVGGEGSSYPNKIIPLEQIGTDATRANAFSKEIKEYYDRSWLGQELGPDGKPYRLNDEIGYQAPPLDGVWATAPYFHNGSVPTLYQVLNSKARPTVFTRSFRTNEEDYDKEKVGWKITVLDRPPDAGLPTHERRRVYDTTQPGRSNKGHPFGDKLTEEERFAVVEYLKRL